ncbi:hypothetical protein BCV70DRAFT_202082 [Testicularia cyperi]|uniref:Uncharacterized protein n=1 Tax=Testicularia cyperi TaxID=1882483 RepID=A0A317XKH2_9BASI|nr:hypothetical protein BCV70DRAFT_202082 [Testicularia cyperi]
MADTLEENYVLDEEQDAYSIQGSDDGAEAEAVNIGNGDPPLEQQDYSGPDDDSSPRQQAEQSTAAGSSSTETAAEEAARKEAKKRKRKEKEKARKQKRAALTAEFAQGVGSVATQPPDMQADYLSSKQAKTFSKLSELEMDEIRLRERMLLDTTSFRDARKEENLVAFVRQCVPQAGQKLSDASDAINVQPGQPAVIVLTGNALRSAELARVLRPLLPAQASASDKSSSSAANAKDGRPAKKQRTAYSGNGNGKQAQSSQKEEQSGGGGGGGATVAKLFARHFKLKEHEAWLKDHITPLAAGTPQRVAALIASGSLKLDSLVALVIDQTWVDQKQRNVFDTPETRDELMKLLSHEKVMAALKRSHAPTKLALF